MWPPPRLSAVSTRLGIVGCVGASLVGLAVLIGPADATFPGDNGRVIVQTRVPFEEGEFTDTLVSVDPRTGKRTRFTAGGCPTGFDCGDEDPSASPNGKLVAFTRVLVNQDRPNAVRPRSDLMIATGDGKRVRRVVEGGSQPAWSPGGRWIAFAAREGGIYLVRPDGSGLRRVTRRDGTDLDWSRRGGLLFSLRGDSRADLYTIRSDGSRPRRLTRSARADSGSWAPDGRSIAFLRYQVTKGGSLYRLDVNVMRADGTGRRFIARDAGSPTWSPDGRRILFENRRGALVTSRPDGSQRRLMTGRLRPGRYGPATWLRRR